ncbi:O-methyltransferase [Acinetobacter haemolyticus]|uniref:O-methyltransferase n=1 Tax=Acinetobacter haemolyticus TaxID=29430 RepID=UPI002A6ACFDE|nr:O-methyltransferase [Acinetobacter haemolyticus]WPO68346.1 O-methyltransferase [Acinetobacter haemolyticus]
MQQLWTDIDDYINSHLIPTDPKLQHALDNTDTQGFSNHLAVAPNQGMFLQMLIQMNQCKRVLELGTFAAYSTIWLAKALPEDGYLLTVEGRDTHVVIAQENIDFAKMPTNIELKKGRGADVMNQLITENSEPFDLIFIDADKQSYPEYLELSLQLAHSGTILVLDNVIRAGDILDENNKKPSIEGIRETFTALKNHPKLLSCTALQTVGSKGHDGFAIAIVK